MQAVGSLLSSANLRVVLLRCAVVARAVFGVNGAIHGLSNYIWCVVVSAEGGMQTRPLIHRGSEHASVLAEDQRIAFEDLPERVRRGQQGSGEVVVVPLGAGDLSVKRAGRALERELILRALEQTDGNRTHAAKALDLSHRALLYKIKEFGLS